MKLPYLGFLALSLAFGVTSPRYVTEVQCAAQRKSAPISFQSGPYQPTWQSLSSHPVPEWFRDAKLGIFLHWGICSVPAYHGWYGLAMYDPETNPEVVEYHRKVYGHPSIFGYKDLIPLWKAEKWNPDALVQEFKQAGARYIMPVAVHHDNFDNYASTYQPWNSVNMGPKRDIVGEWRKSALKYGLHFTVSSHQHEAWDWFHRSYNFDLSGPLQGMPWDAWETKADGQDKWWHGYDPADLYVRHFLPWDRSLDVIHHRMVRTNRGGFINDREIVDDGGKVIGTILVDPDAQGKFIENWYLRTKELIDKYHPEMLYIDWGIPFGHLPCKDDPWLRLNAYYYNASLKWNHGKMLASTNLKHINDWPPEYISGSHDQVRRSCVEDFEGGTTGDRPASLPWQNDEAVNNEWFDDTNSPHHFAKRPADIVRMLVDTVSRNGCLLLNIGLRADGTVPPDDQAALDALKAFMGKNNEAIHSTRPWILAMDRPTDTYFTTRGNVLYAIILRRPDQNRLTVRALSADRSPWISDVQKVSLLGSAQPVKWSRTPQGMEFELPGMQTMPIYSVVLKLTGKGTPLVAAPGLPPARKLSAEQDAMEKAIRKDLASNAGKPTDALRHNIADILRSGVGSFSSFEATIERIENASSGLILLHLKSDANAEVTYNLRITAAELNKDRKPLLPGDTILFDGRYESVTAKSATLDYPVIQGYITRADHVK